MSDLLVQKAQPQTVSPCDPSQSPSKAVLDFNRFCSCRMFFSIILLDKRINYMEIYHTVIDVSAHQRPSSGACVLQVNNALFSYLPNNTTNQIYRYSESEKRDTKSIHRDIKCKIPFFWGGAHFRKLFRMEGAVCKRLDHGQFVRVTRHQQPLGMHIW